MKKIPEKTVLGVPGKILRVMIGAPGDLSKEVETVKESIADWNNQHAQAEGMFLLWKHWKTNSHPNLGNSGQEIINSQITRSADLLIAMFWNRLGTPTETAPSGTVEEIMEVYEAGKSVKIYFSNSPVDRGLLISETARKEIDRLELFKEDISRFGLYSSYIDLIDFRKQIDSHIYMEVRKIVSEGFIAKRRASITIRSLSLSDFMGINEDNWEEKAVKISLYVIQNTVNDSKKYITFGVTDVIKLFQMVLHFIGIKFYRVNSGSKLYILLDECITLKIVNAKSLDRKLSTSASYMYSRISRQLISKIDHNTSLNSRDIYYGFSENTEDSNQYEKCIRALEKLNIDLKVFQEITKMTPNGKGLKVDLPEDVISKIELINPAEYRRQKRKGKGK